MTTAAIIQARMGSSRLPGKVLMPVAGRLMLARIVASAQACRDIDHVIVATGIDPANDPIEAWCVDNAIDYIRGSEEDVLSRYADAARQVSADRIVRLTADCPVQDPAIIAQVIALHRRTGADYASNVSPARWPDGLDCEVFGTTVLNEAAGEAIRPSDREHVTPFIRNNRHRYHIVNLDCPLPDVAAYRWTIDTDADLRHVEALLSRVSAEGEDIQAPVSWLSLVRAEEALAAEVGFEQTNGPRQKRNEGFTLSITKESTSDKGNRPTPSFDMSVAFLERAERTIPLASQTFSKSRVQYPPGAAPNFVTCGDGGRVWDLDGNEYIDLVNGLLCVLLGYRDPDVDKAVRDQLNRGVSFSMATPLEAELAERLVDMIPCAQQVRFAKNGSDATSGAIRIARAATNREQVISCGYHGWHDWYIGSTTRAKGVPEAVRNLTHKVPYNDLGAVEAVLTANPDQIACLIMEPANAVAPQEGYLDALKDLLHRHGALLVFDEIITGFRFARGGAQELFGTSPDLACFGKGMANGFPISATVGRADLMSEFEHVFVSGTFGGEAVSLAAAIATLKKLDREPVVEAIWEKGRWLADAAREAIAEAGLTDTISLAGFDPWRLISIRDHDTADMMTIKTFYIVEMAKRGILTLGSHNMSYAQTEADLAQAASAYREVMPLLAAHLETGRLAEALPVPPLVPVFSVR